MNIEYPVFIEYGSFVIKIEDTETLIDVAENGERDEGIMRKKNAGNMVEMLLKNGHPVSEACFNNAFQNALSKINQMIMESV